MGKSCRKIQQKREFYGLGNQICLRDKIYTLDRLATELAKVNNFNFNLNKARIRSKPQYFSKKTVFAAKFDFSDCIHFIFFFLPLWNSTLVDHFSYKIRARFSLTNKLYSVINKVRSRLPIFNVNETVQSLCKRELQRTKLLFFIFISV